MKRVRYTRYTGDLASEIDLEELLKGLSDYLLDSGYYNPWSDFQDLNHNMDDLREALRRLLLKGDFLSQEMRDKLQQMEAEGTLDELLDRLMERMEQENYINSQPMNRPTRASNVEGQVGEPEGRVRFEVTDKSMDFLGFKTLRDLMGTLGKSSYGRHDTRHWATGIETSGGSRRYEFGDTLNLDAAATLSSAISREGIGLPLNMEYEDLAGAPVRVPELVRNGGDARLLALDDSLRRGPVYAGQARCHGALAPDSHAVSRRFAVAGAVSRFGRRDAGVAAGAGQGWAVAH